MPNRTLVRAVVTVVVLALVAGGAWWAYRTMKRAELRTTALQLVQESTTHLNEALGLITAGSEVRSRLERDFTEVQEHVRKLQSLDASLHPPLVQASDAYITDVQAFLRRQLETHRARDSLHTDMVELSTHIRTGGNRSPEWIKQALELKSRMEKNFFDYRFAAGGLDKSFVALRDTRKGFDPIGLNAVVVSDTVLTEAQQRIQEASALLTKEVEAARKLPVPR